jgi:hypothetical protein
LTARRPFGALVQARRSNFLPIATVGQSLTIGGFALCWKTAVAQPELNIVTEYDSTVATRRQMRPAFKQKTASVRAAFGSYVES